MRSSPGLIRRWPPPILRRWSRRSVLHADGSRVPDVERSEDRQGDLRPAAHRRRLEKFTASPWAYNGKIFALSEDGDTFVIQAGPELKCSARTRSTR